MYLRNLHIRRMKLLRDFELSFMNPDGSPRMWTVIIGENGTGKTTVLQAIALASVGSLQVNALGERVVNVLRDRRTQDSMEIEAEFGFSQEYHLDRQYPPLKAGVVPGPTPPRLQSKVSLAAPTRRGRGRRSERTALRASATYLDLPSEHQEQASKADPLVEARDLRAAHWFVAGYGVYRSLPDDLQPPTLRNPPVDRLRPLFPGGAMIGTGFASHFKQGSKQARTFALVLREALLEQDDLLPAIKQIELRGHGGVRSPEDLLERNRFDQIVGHSTMRVPAMSLSHGYQSTIAWVADLVGHIILEAETSLSPKEMEGVVLIDEIDLYLHPRWQVSIIKALRQTFPRIQFIATTHSPAALVGLRTDRDEIVRLVTDPETGDVRRLDLREGAQNEPDPRFMTGSDIYERYFGMPDVYLSPLGTAMRDYVAIATNPFRGDEEEARLGDLRAMLLAAGAPLHLRPVPRASVEEG